MAVELLPGKPTEEEIRAATLPSCRPEFPPWVLGRLYDALQNKGYRQAKIAEAVGKSQAHVSRCVTVYQGLSPGAHDVLCRLENPPGIHVIVEIALLRDPNGAPDQKSQLDYIERLVGKERTTAIYRHERLLEVRSMPLPDHVAPFVLPVLRYLSGESNSLEFPSEAPCPSPTETLVRPRQARSRTRSTG